MEFIEGYMIFKAIPGWLLGALLVGALTMSAIDNAGKSYDAIMHPVTTKHVAPNHHKQEMRNVQS